MGFPPSFDCGPQQLHRNLRGGAAVAPQDATPPLLGHRAQGVRFDDEDEDETEELLASNDGAGVSPHVRVAGDDAWAGEEGAASSCLVSAGEEARALERERRAQELEELAGLLASRAADWTARLRALQQLQQLLADAAGGGSDADAAAHAALLARAAPWICAQLEDKRSQLVREACAVAALAAGGAGPLFAPHARSVLAALLQLTFVTVKVVSHSAREALAEVAAALPPEAVLPALEDALRDGHAQLREVATELLAAALRERDARALAPHAAALAALAARALGDAAAGVRAAGKDAFACLNARLPGAAPAALAALGHSSMRAQLQRHHRAPPAPGRPRASHAAAAPPAGGGGLAGTPLCPAPRGAEARGARSVERARAPGAQPPPPGARWDRLAGPPLRMAPAPARQGGAGGRGRGAGRGP